MNAKGMKILRQVLEATEGEELLLSGSFEKTNGEHLYCPLGCVVKDMQTKEWDDEHFYWDAAEIESRVERMFNHEIYTAYDKRVNEDSDLQVFEWAERAHVLPKKIALAKFEEALEEVYG